MHDQEFLNKYFSTDWRSSTSEYIYSGFAIPEKIHNDDYVIDVGCGSNPFKDRINHLVGIDPANDQADIQTTIEDYIPDRKYDVALCLGSINFGTKDIIAKQIEKVNDLLHPCARIFWRLNPGHHDHHDENHNPLASCQQIDFFPWTFDLLNKYAVKYGFDQINCAYDSNGKHTRLYAEWHRG